MSWLKQLRLSQVPRSDAGYELASRVSSATHAESSNGDDPFCEGCDVVGCDHAPQAGVAQGVGHGPLVER